MMIAGIDAATASQIGVAVATLVLAGFTARMASQTKKASEASTTAAEAGAAPAKTAAAHLNHANAVAIDARSPLIVPVPLSPSWPPYADDPERPDVNRIDLDKEFIVPDDGNLTLWFRLQVLLRNEGPTSALIWSIDDDGRFIDWHDTDRDLLSSDETTPFVRPADLGRGRYLVPAGHLAAIEYTEPRTVAEFAEAHKGNGPAATSRRRFVVGDQFDAGVADNITVKLSGEPVEPIQPNGTERWRLVDVEPPSRGPMVAVVEPIRRRRFLSRSDGYEL